MQTKHGAKNMERMEEHVPDFNYQNVQNTISSSPWDYRPLMDEIAIRASGLLEGGRRCRLVIDDTGFQKKGHNSVGVARQYLGRLGKIENGQVAVCSSLACGQRSTLVDMRLYLPEAWAADPKRCQKAHVPESEMVYRPKTDLALVSVSHLRSIGVGFDIVSADSGYGSQPSFLHGLDDLGETFVAEQHCNAQVWPEQPWHHREPKSGKAKPLKHPQPSSPKVRIDEWIKTQPDLDWQRLKVRDSDQGWVEVSYLAKRVWVMDEASEEEKCWWLLAWENPDEERSQDKFGNVLGPRRHYALSNAGVDMDVRQLVADGVERNVVERNFREAKSELGMSDYQIRGWTAWHHHMSLVMLAMLFTMQEKMHHDPPDNTPALTTGDILFMLERLLPQRGFGPADPEEIKRMLQLRIRKRYLDQFRRKNRTKVERPPLAEDERI